MPGVLRQGNPVGIPSREQEFFFQCDSQGQGGGLLKGNITVVEDPQTQTVADVAEVEGRYEIHAGVEAGEHILNRVGSQNLGEVPAPRHGLNHHIGNVENRSPESQG